MCSKNIKTALDVARTASAEALSITNILCLLAPALRSAREQVILISFRPGFYLVAEATLVIMFTSAFERAFAYKNRIVGFGGPPDIK